MPAITTLSICDLSAVHGGQAAKSFEEYKGVQRVKIAAPYKNVVCTTAGVEGGPPLAKGVYENLATDADSIRASEMLRTYCEGGNKLPAKAPKSPF